MQEKDIESFNGYYTLLRSNRRFGRFILYGLVMDIRTDGHTILLKRRTSLTENRHKMRSSDLSLN